VASLDEGTGISGTKERKKNNRGMTSNVLHFVNYNSSLSEGKIQTRPLR